jgi:hypothetical protein
MLVYPYVDEGANIKIITGTLEDSGATTNPPLILSCLTIKTLTTTLILVPITLPVSNVEDADSENNAL